MGFTKYKPPWVNDNLLTKEDKHIVANPIKYTFYDWFINIYTREEAEAKLKRMKGGEIT